MTLHLWLGFLVAAILIAVTPGPGAVLSMSTGLRYGYWSALMAILGLQAAILTHLAIVALGLGALLTTSEWAFAVVKFIGAAYLLWLGLQKWRSPPIPVAADPLPQRSGNLFRQGVLVNLTNPKAVVFIGALVPQFIDPEGGYLLQYAEIAATLCGTDIVVMSVYALAAARLGGWLHHPAMIRWQNRVFGGLFVTAGGLLAASSKPV